MFLDGFQYGVSYSLNFVILVENYTFYPGNISTSPLKSHQFYISIIFTFNTIYRIMRFNA